MITRVSLSFSSAVAVTFSLLFLMQALIATGISPIITTDPILSPTILVRKADTDTQKEEYVEPPPAVELPPQIAPVHDVGPDIIGGPFLSLFPNPGIDIPTGMPGRPNGGIVPVAIMQPNYPRRAQQKGLEGYVIVEFIVTDIGRVRNAVVVDSSSSLFNQSALRAVARFKYKPQVVDGVAIETPGVRYLFTFTLED